MGGGKNENKGEKMSKRGQKCTREKHKVLTESWRSKSMFQAGYTDGSKGSCDKAPRQQEECLPVMKQKRGKKGRKRRREGGRCVTGR